MRKRSILHPFSTDFFAVRGERFRFIAAGASTTVFSYLLYLLLLRVLPALTAYGIAYVAGIVWAYTVNTLWVFRGRWRWSGLVAYPLVYVVQALLSFTLFPVLIENFGVSPAFAPLLLLVLLVPVNFVLSKLIVYHTSRHKNAGPGKRS